MTDSDPAAAPGPLVGLRVLVVEDETIIAFLVEDMLGQLGAAEVRAAGDIPAASALVASEPFHLAVLDVNVAGAQIFPVAEALEARGVPMVFASGYGAAGLPAHWAVRPVLQKPFGFSALAAAIILALAAA